MPRVYEKSEAKKRRRGEKNQCAYAMWPRKKKRKDGESRRSRKNTRTRVGALDGFVEAEGAALVGWAILRGPAPLALAARAQASRTTRACASRARPPRLPLFFSTARQRDLGFAPQGGSRGPRHTARAPRTAPRRAGRARPRWRPPCCARSGEFSRSPGRPSSASAARCRASTPSRSSVRARAPPSGASGRACAAPWPGGGGGRRGGGGGGLRVGLG